MKEEVEAVPEDLEGAEVEVRVARQEPDDGEPPHLDYNQDENFEEMKVMMRNSN